MSEIDLTGKWRYEEEYGYGSSSGELILRQEGERLSGKIIFIDRVKGENAYMIQETVVGELQGKQISLRAKDFDIIDADREIEYELDNWYGEIAEENRIEGISRDCQAIEGCFFFERIS